MLDSAMLVDALSDGFPNASVQVKPLRNDGQAPYDIYVSAPLFEGKTLVEQHRMIYALLKKLPGMDFEALCLHTSPGEK